MIFWYFIHTIYLGVWRLHIDLYKFKLILHITHIAMAATEPIWMPQSVQIREATHGYLIYWLTMWGKGENLEINTDKLHYIVVSISDYDMSFYIGIPVYMICLDMNVSGHRVSHNVLQAKR